MRASHSSLPMSAISGSSCFTCASASGLRVVLVHTFSRGKTLSAPSQSQEWSVSSCPARVRRQVPTRSPVLWAEPSAHPLKVAQSLLRAAQRKCTPQITQVKSTLSKTLSAPSQNRARPAPGCPARPAPGVPARPKGCPGPKYSRQRPYAHLLKVAHGLLQAVQPAQRLVRQHAPRKCSGL